MHPPRQFSFHSLKSKKKKKSFSTKRWVFLHHLLLPLELLPIVTGKMMFSFQQFWNIFVKYVSEYSPVWLCLVRKLTFLLFHCPKSQLRNNVANGGICYICKVAISHAVPFSSLYTSHLARKKVQKHCGRMSVGKQIAACGRKLDRKPTFGFLCKH